MIRVSILLLAVSCSFCPLAQTDTINYEESSLGPCYNDDGKLEGPEHSYTVKKFKQMIGVEISIKKFTVGNKQISANGHYDGQVSSETSLIHLNESFCVKIIFGRATENGANKYLYKLIVLKHDSISNCWRSLAEFAYADIYNSKMDLSGFSIGDPDSSEYFRLDEGWFEIDG